MQKAKAAEKGLTTCIAKAAKLEGRLSTLKKSPYLNPEKMQAKLKAHKMTMKTKMERLLSCVGSVPGVTMKTLQSKSYQVAIAEAEEDALTWKSFEAEINKHVS